MNLSARMPSVASSPTSSSPGKRCYGSQDPWKSVVGEDRSGRPGKLSSAGYSKLDYDRAWSSQEWKSEAAAHDRSGKPDKTSWSVWYNKFVLFTETLFSTEMRNPSGAERSFVIDQGNLIIMFMAATMNAAKFMGKNILDNQNSIMNSTVQEYSHK